MTTKSRNALLIDAKNGTVSKVTVGDYKDILSHIGCRSFTTVRLAKDEVLYLDDEGLMNGTEYGFTFKGLSGVTHFRGNGVILGMNQHNGDEKPTNLKFDDLPNFGIVYALRTGGQPKAFCRVDE